MLLLDTKDKMNILETEEFEEIKISIPDAVLNLKLSDFKKFMSDIIGNIKTNKNVVIQLLFDEPTEEEEVLDTTELFTEAIIENLITDKKEQQAWQPRTSLVERLNLLLQSQKQLINNNSKIENFTIQMYLKNKKIYEMIE